MKSITPQLPTILGSGAAMLIAFLSLLTGTSPTTCMMKAMAAFLVFSGFGLLLRFALTEVQTDELQMQEFDMKRLNSLSGGNLDMIVPGTPLSELLDTPSDLAMEQDEEAA